MCVQSLVEIIRETSPEGDYEINYYRIREDMEEDENACQRPLDEPASTVSSPSSAAQPSQADIIEHPLGVVQKMDYPISCRNRGSPKNGLPLVQKMDYPPAPSSTRSRESCSGSITIRDDTIISLSPSSSDLATRFFQAIGNARPSRQKRERAINIINELQTQGYTPEEIDAAIQLAAQRGARDAGLLPYVIGEAIALGHLSQHSQNETSVPSSYIPPSNMSMQSLAEAIKELHKLPPEEYEALRQAALRRFPHRPLPEPAIEGLMAGLLQHRRSNSSDSPPGA
jgi:hypothetical protein